MYKHNNFKILLLIIPVMLNACNKNYLDKNPLDQLSTATFWKSENDIKLALAGCYNWLISDDAGFGAHTIDWSCLSDNAFNWSNHANIQLIAKGQIESTTGGLVSDVYNHDYGAIASCNNFVANISKVELPDSTANKYIAEVRFLRAYFYFHLSNLYGGVPLVLVPQTFTEDPAQLNPKASKDEVIKQVLEDLDFAIAHLPDEPYTGHAVKGSALGLKTKVLLYNDKWEEAATTAKKIIEGGIFHLADSYLGLFLKPSQNNNSEIMFSARYQLPNIYSSLDYQLGWDQWETVQPLQDLVDVYECIDGKSINESPLFDPDNPYTNRDPRLRMTLYVPGDRWAYSSNGVFDPAKDGHNQTGYLPRKYIDTSRAPADYSTRSDQDFVFLRYADILLMYAEAKNEASGPDQSVYEAVNEVRGRKGVNMPPLPAGLSKDQMRKRIRLERRVEFALEGTRYFDLKRWEIADEVIPQIVDPGGDHRKFDQHNYLWPFPQSEIDIDPNLEQNPGY